MSGMDGFSGIDGFSGMDGFMGVTLAAQTDASATTRRSPYHHSDGATSAQAETRSGHRGHHPPAST